MADIAAAMATAQQWVGTVPGVVMVGQGKAEDGSPTVDVWVKHVVKLPQTVNGVEVRVRESGAIEAQ